MDEMLRQLYQEEMSNEETLGVILVEKQINKETNTDYFEAVILIIMSADEQLWKIEHYTKNDYQVAIHSVSTHQINDWLLNSSNRRIVDWLMNGKIVFDRNEYTSHFRKHMQEFPIEERKIRIGVEFAKLIRRLKDGKSHYYSGYYLDAYNQIVHALHHLARLTIIEKGFYPEVTVWDQVKELDSQIYKLYSELVTGSESIEKKLELLLIANEFGLVSKTKLGSAHILGLMGTKREPWSIQELKEQLGMEGYSLELTILLEFLVRKGYVKEIKKEMQEKNYFQRLYQRK